MSALKIDVVLSEIQQNMAEFAPYRRSELFNEFLLEGYSAFTLSSVPDVHFSRLLKAKLCLGTLITLYDDFADRPAQANPRLLECLYQLGFQKYSLNRSLPSCELLVMQFAHALFLQIDEALRPLPHYRSLIEILNFDLAQFYSANRYSSLLTAHPHMNNQMEKRLYTHHNMGMVMAAMIDLMSIEEFNSTEFGSMREVFLMGQRMGRIFNVLATQKREFVDGDITGELSTSNEQLDLERSKSKLRREALVLRRKIEDFETRITTFSVRVYLDGLVRVQKLHQKMEGII